MNILWSILSPFRDLFMFIDGIAYSLLDNAYNIVIELSTGEIMGQEAIKSITNNLYILIGVIAFFRLALVLVNSIIDPEKLNEKGKGLSNIFFRVVGMIILLIVTPFLFSLSYEIQGAIVGADTGKNIIFSTLLGDNASITDKDNNGGKALQNIALSSLITVDSRYLQGTKDNGGKLKVCKLKKDKDKKLTTEFEESDCGFLPLTCVPTGNNECELRGGYIYDTDICKSSNCREAVTLYNTMYVAEDMSPSALANYAGVSRNLDEYNNEEVYVYNYMLIVTTFVGGFMTYIILSFAIDIAVRMFELVVLQILSPLFIATFVDPKSSQSGPFKNWLSAIGKSYASLYIKLAIIALMILLISFVNQAEIFQNMGEISGWVKIIAVIGLLIFAKKAPKWIMDMLGIKGDGLGLWSPKKLRENMAGVGAMSAAVGAGTALVANRMANRQHNKAAKKAAKKEIAERTAAGEKLEKKDINRIKRDHGATAPRSFFRNAVGAANAISQGSKAGKNAESTIAAIKGGLDANAKFKEAHAMGEKGLISKGIEYVGDKNKELKNWAWGDPNELYKKRKKIEDEKNAKIHSGGKYSAGLGKGNIVEGNGDAVKLYKKYGASNTEEAFLAQYCETNELGKDKFTQLKSSLSKDDDGNVFCQIDGKKQNLTESLYASGSGGAENFSKMFNTYQTNSLANYSNSQEQYTQQASAYQGFTNSQNTAAQNAQAIAAALANTLPSALSNIKIDASSMSGVKNAIRDLNNSFGLASEEEQKMLSQKLSELSKLYMEYDYAEKQANITKTSMEQLQKTINELKPIVDGITGITTTEKEQQLAIQLSKLEKTIAGLSKKNEDKKD